jgi:hypothetical protein
MIFVKKEIEKLCRTAKYERGVRTTAPGSIVQPFSARRKRRAEPRRFTIREKSDKMKKTRGGEPDAVPLRPIR